MVADKYTSFEQLHAAESPAHFSVVFEHRAAAEAILLAPHGGRIENHTSEIARRIAADRHSYYAFEGRKLRGNRDLHITSHRFDEPTALLLVPQHRWVVAIHGCNGDSSRVLLGGLDTQLKTAIEARLNAHGVASESVGHRYPGVDPNNICNRGARGVGVQIELTTAFRAGNEWQALINATQEALAAFCRPQD